MLRRLTLTSFFGVMLSGAAYGQSDDDYDDDDGPGWSFEVSTAFESEPAYTGSDTQVSGFGFDAIATYAAPSGTEYFLSLGELGVRFQPTQDSVLQAVLEYEPGRQNEDDPILSGFPKVDDTVELQLAYGRGFGPLTFGAILQVDALNKGKGLVGFVAATYDADLSERLSGTASIDVSFADAEHMNTEVGISQATSAATGLAAYSASSGYKSTSVGVELEYALSEQMSLFSGVAAELYGSNMSKSPLIAVHGRDTTYEAEIGVAYRF